MTFRLTACVATLAAVVTLMAAPGDAGAQPRRDRASSEVETGVTRNVGSTIGQNQFIQMAEEVTNKMLTSETVLNILSREDRPRVVVGDVLNNTDNEDIRVEDLVAKVRETLVNSRAVRVFGKNAPAFDYILAPTLTSSTIRGQKGGTEYTYSLQISLRSFDDEFIEDWSVTKSYIQ